jgi:DNA-binding NarL/FixJ family response regulator
MSHLDIYLVEDNPLLALGLKQMIKSMGHRVCGFASSYEQAITDLNSVKPDLVITDIMLDGNGTGIDLARYINKYLNIPFIYQSSVSVKQQVCEAHATQPEAYLVKPVGPYDLGAAIAAFGQ